jgi:chaperonin GroES
MINSFSIKTLKPAPGYLIVEPAKQDKKTSTGIYLPENANVDKPQYGKVLAVGDATYQDGKQIKAPAPKNATVIYKKWGGNEVEVDKVEYQFLKFEDILAVVSK